MGKTKEIVKADENGIYCEVIDENGNIIEKVYL